MNRLGLWVVAILVPMWGCSERLPSPAGPLQSALLSCNATPDCASVVIGSCMTIACTNHVCIASKIDCECMDDADCNDGNECKTDTCSDGVCKNTTAGSAPGCCTPGGFVDDCAPANSCQLLPGCTSSTCTYIAKRNAEVATFGCCDSDADCTGSSTCNRSTNQCVCSSGVLCDGEASGSEICNAECCTESDCPITVCMISECTLGVCSTLPDPACIDMAAPPDLTSPPPDLTSPPPDLTSPPSDLKSPPLDLTSPPNDLVASNDLLPSIDLRSATDLRVTDLQVPADQSVAMPSDLTPTPASDLTSPSDLPESGDLLASDGSSTSDDLRKVDLGPTLLATGGSFGCVATGAASTDPLAVCSLFGLFFLLRRARSRFFPFRQGSRSRP